MGLVFDMRRYPHIVALLLLACCLLLVRDPDQNAKASELASFGIPEASDVTAELPQTNDSTLGPLSIAEQTEWIQNHFRAEDPNEQDWCTRALLKGPFGNLQR